MRPCRTTWPLREQQTRCCLSSYSKYLSLQALVRRTPNKRRVVLVSGTKSVVHAVWSWYQRAGRGPRGLGTRTGVSCLLWVRTSAWLSSADTGQREAQCSNAGAWYSTGDVNRSSATKGGLNGTSQERHLGQRQASAWYNASHSPGTSLGNHSQGQVGRCRA
ncbi:hypothetical protein MRX96_031681 [Rhipicephalus microplus]